MPHAQQVKRRLFFALLPEFHLRQQLAQSAQQLAAGGRFVPARNLHMTLFFLGATSYAQQLCAERAAASVTARPFTMKISRFGVFKRAGVLWLAPQTAPQALFDLQNALLSALRRDCPYLAALTQPNKPFVPHITVRRKLRHKPKGSIPITSWWVDGFCLLESTHEEGMLIYRVLKQWPFKIAPVRE